MGRAVIHYAPTTAVVAEQHDAGGIRVGGAFMGISAFAQSPEHSTLFDGERIGATDWPVGAASCETPPPQAVTDATAAAQNVAHLIMSIALHPGSRPAEQR